MTLGVASVDSYWFLISMVEKGISMAEKGQTFNSFVSKTPMITLDKLMGNENYQSWANSMDLWFIGNGCEDRRAEVRGRRLATDMSHKASFTSAHLFVPLLAIPRKLLSSSTVVSVIQASPSFRNWFLIFLVYLRVSVSHVSLGNILVSYSQSV